MHRPDQLPTFDDILTSAGDDLDHAYRSLGDASDWLRSDWSPGHGPTDEQAAGKRTVYQEIAAAKAAINRAKDAIRR